MKLVVSHMSALDFWRTVYRADRKLGASGTAPRLDGDLAVNEQDVWALAPSWVTPRFLDLERGVLHVLARSRDRRRRTRTTEVRIWSGDLPDGALYDFGNGALVCSPCFAFLQMAGTLDLPELIALGCELCGTYSLDRHAERGFRTRRHALMSPGQLERFLDGARGSYGEAKARRALPHIVAGAASPRETLVALLLALPYRLGGYSLPRMQMNRRIDLAPAARRLCGKSFLRADLCYPDARLVIEYLGARDHEGAAALRSNRSRTNALVEMGFDVIELTSNQVNDVMAFDVIALQIAKRLCKRIRLEKRGAIPQRMCLRRALFAWHAASGRPRRP